MTDDILYKTDKECKDMLQYIFRDALQLNNKIAPDGWKHSEFVLLLHPTPEQQYEEYIRISENINRLTKKTGIEKKDIHEFQQDDLGDIPECKEFLYVLGLTVYDIFSNNHEVIGADNKVYDLGSFRGSGGFIADFLNEYFPEHAGDYDYLDFYMGTYVIGERGNLLPFYEYIFQKIKDLKGDWRYHFPRMYVIDPKQLSDNTDSTKPEDYSPEQSMRKQLETIERDKEIKNLRDDLDKIHREEYENARYQPLIPLVQAYKNVYGKLPDGYPSV
ncbi:hypothetical protein FW774_16795 [Pedobacter sp. BS3]|uniref:hypothetical protein n=1 Tax=Pedobacter sp. BS3 TaxID=2567937 RepID=UPI0011ECDA89|nr:hypothetical protein [Pedobacter sp. BS3]TZF81713.1 hypothetical protein FW774_16795 [Pedobacter sp. BS3]